MRVMAIDASVQSVISPPSPWRVFSDPVRLFGELKAPHSSKRALLPILIALPVLPIVLTIGSLDDVRNAMLAQPTLADRAHALAPIVSVFAGMVTLLMQTLLLGAHLVTFLLMTRIFPTTATRRSIVQVWAYAMFPTIIRQAVLIGFVLAVGPRWLKDHSSVLTVADPFVMYMGFLFYSGCRNALGYSRLRAAGIAFMLSAAGALGMSMQMGG